MPVVLLAHRVPGPVGRLGVDEDDARFLVELVGVGPDVEVAVRPVGVLAAGLEPRVLVAGVVHDEVDDHADVALVRLVEEVVEVLDGAGLGKDVGVVGDVVAAVAQGRGEERRHPQAVDAQPVQVVELLGQAAEVADAVAVGVLERPHQDLVEDGRLEPVGLVEVRGGGLAGGAGQHAALAVVVASSGSVETADVSGPPDRQDVRRLVVGVEVHEVVRPPLPVLAGDLVVHGEGVLPVESDRGQVQVDHRGARRVRVDVDHHDDEVALTVGRVRGVDVLAVDEHGVVVAGVDGDVAQLLQRGVGAADLVEPA